MQSGEQRQMDSGFLVPKIFVKFQWDHPQWGYQIEVG